MPVIGLIEVSIRLHGIHSLKGKRSIVRPILMKLSNNFNCGAVESDMLDSHDEAVISVVSINTSSVELTKTMEKIEDIITENGILESQICNKEIIQRLIDLSSSQTAYLSP